MTTTPTPTQVEHPWRSTARTVFQAFVGLCFLAPILISEAGLDPDRLPVLAGVLAVAAVVTRLMAIPAVNDWLERFLPFLAANHPSGSHSSERGAVDTLTVGLYALGSMIIILTITAGVPWLMLVIAAGLFIAAKVGSAPVPDPLK